MKDEATELAVALGESQNAQIEAESKAVTLDNENKILKTKIQRLETRIFQLEEANVNMDVQLQGFRTEYKPRPADIDRG